jgi:formate hydrogenlyase subunit 6/NADH:ubiquinone oxidoreductase subunit I
MFRLLPRIVHNIVQGPATRNFPTVSRPAFELARGTIEFKMETCKFCGACALKCPANAISVNRQEKKLDFEPFRCISCAACIDACRFECVHMTCDYRSPEFKKPMENHVEPKRGPEPEVQAS